MTGSMSRWARNRSSGWWTGQIANTMVDTMMEMAMTMKRKLVPHLGWCRGCLRTFSTVRGRPAS